MLYRLIFEAGEPMLCEPEEIPRIMTALKQELPVRIKTGVAATAYLVQIVGAPKEKGPLADIFASLNIAADNAPPTATAQQEKPEPDAPKKPKEHDPWKRAAVHK